MSSRRSRWLARAGLLSLGLLVALGLAEGLLRVFLPPRTADVGSTDTDKAGLYGWSAAPLLRMEFVDPDTGERAPFTTNSKGWKDVEHEFEKPAGVVRVLFVGDSFTWGFARLEQVYGRVTEQLFQQAGHENVEVISLGVGGWGTDQELEALRTEGLLYRPDLVVYQFSPNDVIDNVLPDPSIPARSTNDGNYAAKPFRYRLDETGELVRETSEGAAPRRSFGSWLAQHSALAHHVQRLLASSDSPQEESTAAEGSPGAESSGLPTSGAKPDSHAESGAEPGTPASKEARWQLLAALTLEMQRLAESVGAHFAIYTHTPKSRLAAMCQANGLTLIEPRREYERYHTDPHSTAAGNRAMAEDLVEVFLEWDWFHARLDGRE